MKLLLTSAGIKNPSIEAALVELLGKPIAECRALCIPTAQYGHPLLDASAPWRFISGNSPLRLSDVGWGSLGVLELTALPTIDRERWTAWVDEADALLATGGCARYLGHWMRESGLAELIPRLDEKVWVGLSAGSMVMAPRIGSDFVEWQSAPDDKTLGIVDFSIFPHLENHPENTIAEAERWAAEIGGPAYAIDDETAIRVVDGNVDVVSEGQWRALNQPQ